MRQEVAFRMLERLTLINIEPHSIIDAGCGPYENTVVPVNRFTGSSVLSLDMSWPILSETKLESRKSGRAVDFICGDFALMPFGDLSVDLIWSNLALHWHPEPLKVFREFSRVLKPDGLLMFSCFGAGTFSDLKKSFSEIDHYSHVHTFQSMIELGDLLIDAGFTEPVLERERIDLTYRDVEKLLADVRAFGGNAMSDRRKSLFGKHEYAKLLKSLENNRDDNGKLSLGFEIIYAHAFKKDFSRPAGEKVIQFYARDR